MDAVKAEVLRYLGHKGQEMSPDMDALIDTCIAECRAVSAPKAVWRLFDVDAAGPEIKLSGTPLVLPGDDIWHHLRKAKHAAVMAVTLGVAVDSLIRNAEYTDMTRSVILDACATALVEEACDAAEAEIIAEANARDLTTNSRYSPGYGDLPLAIQPTILDVLGAQKGIGLTCSDSLILLPRKSVTAFVGLREPKGKGVERRGGCSTCPRRDTCKYRKADPKRE